MVAAYNHLIDVLIPVEIYLNIQLLQQKKTAYQLDRLFHVKHSFSIESFPYAMSENLYLIGCESQQIFNENIFIPYHHA